MGAGAPRAAPWTARRPPCPEPNAAQARVLPTIPHALQVPRRRFAAHPVCAAAAAAAGDADAGGGGGGSVRPPHDPRKKAVPEEAHLDPTYLLSE